jgi:hypothetical protein
VFRIVLDAYRDGDHVEAATSSKLTIGTGDQDDAIALAPASNTTLAPAASLKCEGEWL